MIKHIVLIKWNDGVTPEQVDAVEDAFSEMVETFDYIVSYEYGPDAGIYENEYDYALVAEFETPEQFKSYAEDERHFEIMKEVISPLMADYKALQFVC